MFKIVQGFPKIYLACLSDVSRNGSNFLKLTRGPLKFHIGAGQLRRVLFISDIAQTLKFTIQRVKTFSLILDITHKMSLCMKDISSQK